MSKNFPFDDCELLITIVDKYKEIVENKFTNAYTNHKKAEAWDLITDEFNAVCRRLKRSSKQVRNKYKHLKHNAVKTISTDKVNTFKTGGGVYKSKSTPLDAKLQSMEVLTQPIPCEFDSDAAYDNLFTREREDPVFDDDSYDNDTLELSQNLENEEATHSTPRRSVDSPSSVTTQPIIISSSVLRNHKPNANAEPEHHGSARPTSAVPTTAGNSNGDQENLEPQNRTPHGFKPSKLTRGLKRKPNASVKASEAIIETTKFKKICAEQESEQLKRHHEEEHAQLIRIREKEHEMQLQILSEKLLYYRRLNSGNGSFEQNDML